MDWIEPEGTFSAPPTTSPALVPWVEGAAVVLPDKQMVSTTLSAPAAHTCEVPGALATANNWLFLPAPVRAELGKALQEVPFQCCVEATYRSPVARYSKPTAHALVGEEASMSRRAVTPPAALALGT